MKAKIHPTYYPEAVVTCVCGNSFTVGSTVPEIKVEVCAKCHPFYTGQMKYVDTAGRVDKFKAAQKTAGAKVLSKTQKRQLKKQKRIEKDTDRPTSLAELRVQKKKKSKSKAKK